MEMRKVSDINVNKHAQKTVIKNNQYYTLKAHIQEHGIINPLIVNRNGQLVNGLLRLEVAKELGWPEVPVTMTDTSYEVFECRQKMEMPIGEYARLMAMVVEKFGIKETANRLARTEGSIRMWLKASKLDDRILDYADEGRLGVTVLGLLSNVREDLQYTTAVMCLDKTYPAAKLIIEDIINDLRRVQTKVS